MRIVLLFITLGTALAIDWPQWRGAGRDGISPETGLLKTWPAEGPKLVWKASGLGEGFSAFSILNGRLYTQGQRGDQEFVMAYNTADGKKLWETPAGSPFRERRGHGPRGTPTTDGNRLYALSADGTLLALNVADGKKIWGYNIVEKYKGEVPHWGISESPLVDGNNLIVTPGGSDGGVVALNKTTGEPIWRSQKDPAAYSSPIIVNYGKVRQYVVFTANAALGLNASTGELLWRYDKVVNRTANIATPIYHDGHIFVSSDYGTGCALLRLDPNTGKASEVYFNQDMKNHYSSSVLVGKHLYGFSSQILTAMDLMTGQVAWRDRSVGKGSVTYADGHLYVYSEQGRVALVEATPEAYKEKARFAVPQGSFNTWTPPVIANGRLYLREQDTLYSFDIKAN